MGIAKGLRGGEKDARILGLIIGALRLASTAVDDREVRASFIRTAAVYEEARTEKQGETRRLQRLR